jgi:coniferyl-aldehyde dehydrogenase
MYPTLHGNPDYTTIINQRHYERLQGLLADAQARGAQVLRIAPAGESESPQHRTLAPALLLDVQPDMAILREEIFGPLLPLVPYDTLGEALAFVNARPRPLALYWFGRDRARQRQVLTGTVSGGVTVNDVLLHIAQENLPFGGIGESGIGAYHGEYGFRLFSKEKPVFEQSEWAGTALLRPPYDKTAERVLRMLKRFV